MKRKSGGISIFLAVTFLSLIVFVMSIVEVTRYQILKAQAERMVISATQSVLAGYDSALKNEYGLFARNPAYSDRLFVMPESATNNHNPMSQDFAYYLESNSGQSIDDVEMSLVDKLVFARDRQGYFNPSPFTMTNSYIVSTYPLKSHEGLDYLKQDMLAYMEMNLPLLALKPILETFGAAEKLGKTSQFIGDKNNQIEKAASIESLWLDLYRTIDGVVIDERTGSITIEDSNYVNRLIGSPNTLGQRDHIPAAVGQNAAFTLYDCTNQYEASFKNIEGQLEGLSSAYDVYGIKSEAVSRMERSIGGKEEDVEETLAHILEMLGQISDLSGIYDTDASDNRLAITALEKRLDTAYEEVEILEADIGDLNSEKKELNSEINGIKTWMKDRLTVIESNQVKINGYQDQLAMLINGSDSYLGMTEHALATVKSIGNSGASLTDDIDRFLASSEADKDAYITSTYEQSVLDLKALRNSYAQDEDGFGLRDNLSRIDGILRMNQSLLEGESLRISALVDDYKDYLIALFKANDIEKTVLKDIIDLTGSDVTFYTSYLQGDPWLTSKTPNQVPAILSHVASNLEGYGGGGLLDYSGYEGLLDDNGQVADVQAQGNQVIDQMRSFIELYSLDKTLSTMDPGDVALPSGLFSENFNLEPAVVLASPNTDYDVDAYKNGATKNEAAYYMEAGQGAYGITAIDNIKEQILLNEYAVAMFRSFPDGHRQGVETISGYDKKDHLYQTELEYIYTGLADSNAALRNVAVKIFGLRVAFNSVHLATDLAKRATITNIATMIAGWWTVGIGTLILSLIIGLLWATIESLVDLKKLVTGTSVPLLKTSMTWYTGMEGMADLVIDTGTDLLLEVADETLTLAADQAREYLGDYESRVTEEVSQVINDEVIALLNEADQMTGMLVEDFEKAFYELIDGALLTYHEGAEKLSVDDYFQPGTQEHLLAEKVLASLLDQIDQEIDGSYASLLEAKSRVLNLYQAELESVKAHIATRVREELGAVIHLGFGTLSSEITRLEAQGIEVSAAYIRNKMQGYREGLTEKTKTVASDVKPMKSKMDPTMIIPNVSYEMYLRLFMMMDYEGLDQRVLRMMDLIDYNLALGRHGLSDGKIDGDLLMMDQYVYGVTGGGEFEFDYLFLNLPYKAFKRDFSDDFYTVQVKAVNSYE